MTREVKLLALSDARLETEDKSGTVAGYASVFNGVDSYRDTILPGAYARTIADWKTRGYALPIIDEHWGATIGKWTHMEEDSLGLRVKGELTPGHSRATDVLASLRHGAVSGLSIGFRAVAAENAPDGRRLLKEIDLLEISVVTMPADSRARVDAVKAITDIESKSQAERLLGELAPQLSGKWRTAFVSKVSAIALRDAEAKRLEAEWLADMRRRVAALTSLK